MNSTEQEMTPGPWVVEEFATLQEAQDAGGFDWVGTDSRGPIADGPVGSVYRDTGKGFTGLPGCIETTLANARLIAAAPELLAAVTRVACNAGADKLGAGITWQVHDDDMKALEAAYRKATEGR